MPSPDPSEAANGSAVAETSAIEGVETSTGGPSSLPANPGVVELWPLALAAGLLAGPISWGAEELELRVSDPIAHYQRGKGVSYVDATKEMRRLKRDATTRTAMTSYGLLGGLLGLGLGLTGGRARSSWARGLTAGAVGLVAGWAAGAALSWKLVPMFFDAAAVGGEGFADDLTFPMLVHLGLWVSAGVAGGLGLGIGTGSWRQGVLAVLGGAAGAALGTVLSEFGSALAFPMAEANLPISTQSGSRLLAHMSVAVVAALGAAGAAQYLSLSRTPATGRAGDRQA